MSQDRPLINVPNMCKLHQSLLIHQCYYTENDTWRSLIIMANLALFQGASADPEFWKKLDDDITNIDRIKCLACFKPDKFGEIINIVLKKGQGAIKALGESWLKK